MTPEELAKQLRELREKATKGEWVAPVFGFDITTPTDETGRSTAIVRGSIEEEDICEIASECHGGESFYTMSVVDRNFIAFCGTHAPTIAAALESQAKQNKQLRQTLIALRAAAIARQNIYALTPDLHHLRSWEVIQAVDDALSPEVQDGK